MTAADDVYSDDEEHYSDDAVEEGEEEDGGPTLFIDGGTNADSPARHGHKAVILAASMGNDDVESLAGASEDLETLGLRHKQRKGASQGNGGRLASDGYSDQAAAEAAGEEDAVNEDEPVMADPELLAMPSLDIIGEGNAEEGGDAAEGDGEGRQTMALDEGEGEEGAVQTSAADEGS